MSLTVFIKLSKSLAWKELGLKWSRWPATDSISALWLIGLPSSIRAYLIASLNKEWITLPVHYKGRWKVTKSVTYRQRGVYFKSKNSRCCVPDKFSVSWHIIKYSVRPTLALSNFRIRSTSFRLRLSSSSRTCFATLFSSLEKVAILTSSKFTFSIFFRNSSSFSSTLITSCRYSS